MANRIKGTNAKLAILVVAMLILNAVLGFFLAQSSERAITEQIQARMMDLARTAASQLDGDTVKAISEKGRTAPGYPEAMHTLETFQDNTDVVYVYCLGRVGDEPYTYIIDPADDPAYFGEPAVYTDAMKNAFLGQASINFDAYEDRWGRFYTAYCPVFDSNNQVAGVVGVDFEAAWYESHSADIDRMVIINTLASLIIAIIAVVVMARMNFAETKHYESLERANHYDSLTGLANMGHFLDLADKHYYGMVAKGQEPAMLYIDLIGMKQFNQEHSFAEGDKLLQAFAQLLAQTFETERCGRFGQDRFAVSTYVEGLEDRIGALIEKMPDINGGKSLPVHIGIHLDSVKHDGAASIACDRAKTACDTLRNTRQSEYAYFNTGLMAKIDQERYILDNLDRALEEGWIVAYYQAIVRSSTGKVCNEEVLARWIDPERGLLSPNEFIPVLEEARLVYKLDLRILEIALGKMERTAQRGLYVVPASINLSGLDFETCDIVEEVRSRVDASSIERDKINIEITETAIASDFEFMKEQVDRFRELGFNVWMDDFGSKYSSLDYLQRLDVDLLKLDMRFMQQFDNSNDKSKIILTELVKLALGLGIETIAEGVETEEQADFLRKIGCSKMQGFYFTKPNSLASILERYANDSAIGFENPSESDYYSALGCVNLYDLNSITRGEDNGLKDYFDTTPMAVIECNEAGFAILRCNRTYFRFIKNTIGDSRMGQRIPFAEVDPHNDNPFIMALRECAQSGNQVAVEETINDGTSVVSSLLRCVAVNPVTGASGIVVAVLSILEN